MATVFLIMIFLAFISLGLPDSGFSVAWPYLRADLNVPLESYGLITIIATLCGAISSIVSINLTKRFNTGLIVSVSGLLTGLAMLGFSYTNNFYFLLICAIPLGFGAGGVDASLNNYVSKHYSSQVMNWLHACWGVGSMISPIIMTFALTQLGNWKYGFRIVATIQLTLALIFFLMLKLWNNNKVNGSANSEKKEKYLAPTITLKNLTPWLAILTFFFYVGAENSFGSWLNSLLVEFRHINETFSGSLVATYFGSIMLGRILTGFISNKLGNRKIIKYGIIISLSGIILLVFKNDITMVISVLLIGLGFAPIFPSLMHETSRRFSDDSSSKVISYQMAASNISMLTISPLMGVIGSRFSLEFLPFYLLILVTLLLISTTVLNRLTIYQVKNR